MEDTTSQMTGTDLHELDVLSNARQGLAWQGVQFRNLWPVLGL